MPHPTKQNPDAESAVRGAHECAKQGYWGGGGGELGPLLRIVQFQSRCLSCCLMDRYIPVYMLAGQCHVCHHKRNVCSNRSQEYGKHSFRRNMQEHPKR